MSLDTVASILRWAQVGQPGPRNTHEDFVDSNWKLAKGRIDQPGEIQNPETSQALEGSECKVSDEMWEVEANSQCQDAPEVSNGQRSQKGEGTYLKRAW